MRAHDLGTLAGQGGSADKALAAKPNDLNWPQVTSEPHWKKRTESRKLFFWRVWWLMPCLGMNRGVPSMSGIKSRKRTEHKNSSACFLTVDGMWLAAPTPGAMTVLPTYPQTERPNKPFLPKLLLPDTLESILLHLLILSVHGVREPLAGTGFFSSHCVCLHDWTHNVSLGDRQVPLTAEPPGRPLAGIFCSKIRKVISTVIS